MAKESFEDVFTYNSKVFQIAVQDNFCSLKSFGIMNKMYHILLTWVRPLIPFQQC